jgi:hypothetical protein
MIKAKAGGLMTQNREMINLDEIPAERDSTTFLLSSILFLRRRVMSRSPELF